MHELSVSSAIVDTAVRHAAGRRISVVSLTLGKLRQVVPESLSFYFEIVGRDTVCEGARLDLEMVNALMRCASCEHEWDPAPRPEHGDIVGGDLLLPQFRCPECQAAGAEVLRGNELEVESIEVEDQITPAGSSASRPVPPDEGVLLDGKSCAASSAASAGASGSAGPLGAAGREIMNREAGGVLSPNPAGVQTQ